MPKQRAFYIISVPELVESFSCSLLEMSCCLSQEAHLVCVLRASRRSSCAVSRLSRRRSSARKISRASSACLLGR